MRPLSGVSRALAEKEREEYIEESSIGTYPCVRQEAYAVTPERAEAVRSLQRIYEREIFATEIHLFGFAGFSIDLREDLLALCPSGTRKVPYKKIEEALDRFLRRTGIYADVMDKVEAFETSGHAGSFLSTLSVCDAPMKAHAQGVCDLSRDHGIRNIARMFDGEGA